MLNFNVCVCVRGGGEVGSIFYVVVFNFIFSITELNTKSFSCRTNRIWKNISSTTFTFNANIFIYHTKG